MQLSITGKRWLLTIHLIFSAIMLGNMVTFFILSITAACTQSEQLVSPIVMLILSFFGGFPKKMRWHSLGLYLMVALQYMTVGLSGKFPYITALHPVIAMLLFWLSLVVLRTSLALIKTNKNRS